MVDDSATASSRVSHGACSGVSSRTPARNPTATLPTGQYPTPTPSGRSRPESVTGVRAVHRHDGDRIARRARTPGETTGGGESRFDGVLDKENPDIVLLMEGTNDHFYEYPHDGIQARLSSMVQKALNHGCPVILATIPPVISNEYRNRAGQAARIRAFNPRIYDIGAATGIPIARVYEYLTSVPNWERELMDQPTANHPNDAGYRYVRDAFFEQVADGMENGSFY